VVTVTSTTTSEVFVRAGEVTVSEVPSALTVIPVVTAVPPKLTAVAPSRFVPLTVTRVPPAMGPALASTAFTVGAALLKGATTSVKVCELLPRAFVAVIVMTEVPDPEGVPAMVAVPSPASIRLRPAGRPEEVKDGAGVPLAAMSKLKRKPVVAVAEFAVVMTGPVP
jgi:hypothetical protein